MIDQLLKWGAGLLALPYGKEIFVMFISMIPIVELRGGVPAAIALGIDPLKALLICCIGNMIPVPFIIWFLTPIFAFLRKNRFFKSLVEKMENKAEKSRRKRLNNLEFWALFIFVAIPLPLPATGAWTGCLIVSVFNMDKKKSLLTVCGGIITAGLIMLVTSLLVKGAFS